MNLLRYMVLGALFFAFTALVIQLLRGRRYGNRKLYSDSAGDAGKGIAYALSKGMMPWEKESAYKHLPTYMAGMIYHTGIFAAAGWALSLVLNIILPTFITTLLSVLIAVGFLSGLGLLAKRIVKSPMRSISCLDDYLSNTLVDMFLLFGFLSILWPGTIRAFLIISIITLVYMPMGKIRHCFYFFYSRILFGFYFGRRGVLPHQNQPR